VADPVGDAEGAEIREISVVEDQDEIAAIRPQPLDRMPVSARKIPDVSGAEIDDLGMPVSMVVTRQPPRIT